MTVILDAARIIAIGLVVACNAKVPSSETTTAGVPNATATATTPRTASTDAAPTATTSSNPAAATHPTAAATTNPTAALPPFVALPVPGFGDAVVATPEDPATASMVVVATHGNYDRPEWSCEVFSDVFARKAFVVCPRGVARPDSPAPDDIRFTYESNQKLEREVDAALAAFRAAPYARHLPKEGGVVWVGFSLGAIMGVAIAARRPADFPTLVLVEGGVDRMTDDVVRKLQKGGAKHVLFACAQRGCAAPARGRAARLEAAGIRSAVVDAGNIGHTYSGKVAEGIKEALPGLLAR